MFNANQKVLGPLFVEKPLHVFVTLDVSERCPVDGCARIRVSGFLKGSFTAFTVLIRTPLT